MMTFNSVRFLEAILKVVSFVLATEGAQDTIT